MYDQIPNQFLSFGKQAMEATFKAQHLALANFEQIAGLHLKTLEDRVGATLSFLGEAAEVRDAETAKTVWPKGIALVKESSEQFYSVGQQAMNASLKASEAMNELVKSQFEAANDGVTKATPAKSRAR